MHARPTIRSVLTLSGYGLLLGGAFVLTLILARLVEQSEIAHQLVQSFGYAGVLIIAIIAGLNALVPIPAATFVPVFLAGDLTMPLIIATLAAGTVIADIASYFLGRFGRDTVSERYPRTCARFRDLHEKHTRWLPYAVFAFAAFVPFPNEAFLVPFGVLGVSLWRFIVPVILGAIVYQTLAAYGVENIFRYFF
jgi:membrane protein DedA with SNARE-associated domain